MDEGYTVNAVISVIHNGYSGDSSILDSGGKYFCPLYCFPTQIISQITGQNAFSYRLLAAIFGVIFILLAFFLTKIFFKNNKAALLSAFFISFSYYQIAWSRQARWYTMLEVFFWLALLLFYLFLKAKTNKQKIFYFTLSIIFTILAIATHKLAYLLPLIMLIWYFIVIPAQAGIQFMSKKFWLSAFASMAIAAALITFAEYGLGLHFIANAIKNISFHYELPYYLSFYLRNYWPFILIGIYGYFSAEKEQKKNIALLAVPFLLYLFFLSFFTSLVYYRYLFHTTVALYVISAVSAIDILNKIIHIKLSFPRKRESSSINSNVISQPRPAKQNIAIISFAILLFLALFFLTGEGLIFPKNFYFLEADVPAVASGNKLLYNRPYYAYTPQPNFNAAYDSIKKNLQPGDIVISSHPQFTKIFLNQPGYWIKYNYLGMEDTPNTVINNKEYYVGAEIINNLAELKTITQSKHGYIVFDYQSTNGRIDPQIINYIQTNLQLFFYNKINSYSQIWVYSF
jgi:4-amino-4-deoxy-L-arabinose transferase-like glycosyltransferase